MAGTSSQLVTTKSSQIAEGESGGCALTIFEVTRSSQVSCVRSFRGVEPQARFALGWAASLTGRARSQARKTVLVSEAASTDSGIYRSPKIPDLCGIGPSQYAKRTASISTFTRAKARTLAMFETACARPFVPSVITAPSA